MSNLSCWVLRVLSTSFAGLCSVQAIVVVLFSSFPAGSHGPNGPRFVLVSGRLEHHVQPFLLLLWRRAPELEVVYTIQLDGSTLRSLV